MLVQLRLGLEVQDQMALIQFFQLLPLQVVEEVVVMWRLPAVLPDRMVVLVEAQQGEAQTLETEIHLLQAHPKETTVVMLLQAPSLLEAVVEQVPLEEMGR